MVVVDPPFAIEGVLDAAERLGAPHRRTPRDAHPRRPRLRSRPPRAGARDPGRHPSRCRRRVRPRPARGRGRDRRRQRPRSDASTTPATGRRLLLRRRDPLARRAMARPHGRLAVRGGRARPDLAVGAAEGAEAMFHSLQRIFELSDASRCSRATSRLAVREVHELAWIDDGGIERRFNPMVGIGELDAFVVHSSDVATPKHPHRRIVDLNRGAFVGAQARSASSARHPKLAVLDVRRSTTTWQGISPVPSASDRRVDLLDEGRLRADGDAPITGRRHAGRGPARSRGARSVALFDIAGYVLGGRRKRPEG